MSFQRWIVVFLALGLLSFAIVGCGGLTPTPGGDCTVAGSECDAGNTCDTVTKKCACAADACGKLTGKGCNPESKVCEAKCTGDADCTDGLKCVGDIDGKFCIKGATNECETSTDCKDASKPACDKSASPFVCKAHECAEHSDCTDATKPYCDKAGSPKRCINVAPTCGADADCAKDPRGAFCDMVTKACVGCTNNTHCTNGQICDVATSKCMVPPTCTDTATCYTTNPKSACVEPGVKLCETMPATCSSDVALKEDNTTWDTDSAAGKGSVIWGVNAVRSTNDACWSYADANGDKTNTAGRVSCTDDNDCASNSKCFSLSGTKYCGKANSNGFVTISFKYYNKAGQFPSDCNGACVKSHADAPTRKLVWDSSATGTSGMADFGFCMDNAGTYSFWILDNNNGASNQLCYTVGAR